MSCRTFQKLEKEDNILPRNVGITFSTHGTSCQRGIECSTIHVSLGMSCGTIDIHTSYSWLSLVLDQASSLRSSWATCCRKRYLKCEKVFNHFPGEAEIESQSHFKIYKLFIYGVLHYIIDVLCKSVLKIVKP
jgi:hypothetical protein